MKKSSSILWGLILIAVGVVFALNALDITSINIFFDGWWTLFIIIPCLIGLFTTHEKFGNLIGVAVGVFLLLHAQGIMTFHLTWKLIVPVIIILVGLKLIFNTVFADKRLKIMAELEKNNGEVPNGYAAFGGKNMNFDGENFEGAELTAVFGGVKCDISRAVIAKDCVINASAIFGGVDIIVPNNVNVKVKSTSIFGGISDKKRQNSSENTVTLYVNGTCMFGGIEIK